MCRSLNRPWISLPLSWTVSTSLHAPMRLALSRLLQPLWQLYDALTPKRGDHWAFATHHLHTGRFIENQRAMFESVKADPAIRKIIFYRGQAEDFQIEDAVNYEIVEHGTLRGLRLLALCKVVFLTHSISMDFSLRWGVKSFTVLKLALQQRVVVNLWHGIPLKRLLYAANEGTHQHTERVAYRREERRGYAGLIASSDVDSYAMAAMFYPLNYRQVWLTGLPRNDFLSLEPTRLPRYIRDSLERIRALKRGRRLVVYAPTYRQTAVSANAHYYQFAAYEVDALKAVLRRHGAVLGYRPHYFKNSTEYFNLDQFLDGDELIDLSQAAVPEFSAVARECDVLVTDYSSVYIETLYLGKPAVCFAYDLDNYRTEQDGLLYDMDLAFPGPVYRDFNAVLRELDAALGGDAPAVDSRMATAQKLFFAHRDAFNSRRVYDRVKESLEKFEAK